MAHTPTRFSITYRDGGYYVSIPNYQGGEVVTTDAHDELVATLKAISDRYEDQDINHKDFRIWAKLVSDAALAKAGATP